MMSEYPSCPKIHDVWISMMFKYPWCPNNHDVWISLMSEYPWCPNVHDVRISMMSEYPWCPNIHDVQISMMSKYPNVHPQDMVLSCAWWDKWWRRERRAPDDDDTEWNAPVDLTASLQVKIKYSRGRHMIRCYSFSVTLPCLAPKKIRDGRCEKLDIVNDRDFVGKCKPHRTDPRLETWKFYHPWR